MESIYKVRRTHAPAGGRFHRDMPARSGARDRGGTVKEALANASDALAAVIEAYEDLGKPLPAVLLPAPAGVPMWLETAVALG